MSGSSHAGHFVLKGGVLLAAFDARRSTRDIDVAAVDVVNDLDGIRALISDVLTVARDDGLEFDPTALTAEAIRDDDLYGGVRVTVRGVLSTAVIHSHIDINLGDPLWPPPDEVLVPRLLGGPPIRIRGYRVELVLAEKIGTAVQRGTANTRWRDFADIAILSRQEIDRNALVESIMRVAAFREVSIRSLRDVLAGYPDVAQQRWAAWRRKQGLATTAPALFEDLLEEVIAFADPILESAAAGTHDR